MVDQANFTMLYRDTPVRRGPGDPQVSMAVTAHEVTQVTEPLMDFLVFLVLL